MINIFIFLSIVFILTFLLGRLLEKIKIPWVFASLLLGVILAFHNPFIYITQTPVFDFLANMGMYFLLFVIGFEIDLFLIRKNGKFIFNSAIVIIFLEGLLGAIFIHYVFAYAWLISFIVALSFATVGEAILVPILDEFKIINTKLGQTIIGIGTLDDILEILILLVAILYVGSGIHTFGNIIIIIMSLLGLLTLTFGLKKLKAKNQKFRVYNIETLFLFTIAILFLFLGIGLYASSAALGAILAGVGLRTFIPNSRLILIENEIRSVCYGLFAPIFFLWVGLSLDLDYLFAYPILIILIIIISGGAKIISSLIVGKKELGVKQSILLGTGLSVRFSTSIVIIKILFENEIINQDLYSTIIASSIIFTFIIPILFSQLLKKYKKEIT